MALKNFFFGSRRKEEPDKQKFAEENKNQFALYRGTEAKTQQPDPRKTRYYVRREEMTGVTEYTCCHGSRNLGTASAVVMPSFPVFIRGCDLRLATEFDKTIFPGVTREIRDEESGQVYATVVWYGDGTHALNLPGNSLVVKTETDGWRFLREGRQIAIMRKSGEPGETVSLMASDPISDVLALMLLCFPLLQIAR